MACEQARWKSSMERTAPVPICAVTASVNRLDDSLANKMQASSICPLCTGRLPRMASLHKDGRSVASELWRLASTTAKVSMRCCERLGWKHEGNGPRQGSSIASVSHCRHVLLSC